MDIDVSRWILEFLLRQPLEDRIFGPLFRFLPIANDDSSLKRNILLRTIESEILTGSVSVKVLELLEGIEELDYEQGIECSGAMMAAYCSVAVECTVRFLEGNDKDKEWKYFDAVKRIWRGRVWEMEKLERVGLVSWELLAWKDHIEAAVCDANVRENLYARSKRNDALEAVQVYLAEAKERRGPSFLELVAHQMSDDSFRAALPNPVREALTFGSDRMFGRLGEKITTNSTTEMHKENVPCRRKHVAPKRYRRATSGISRGAKIDDTQECGLGTSGKQYDLPPTPEVNKVLEALESRSMELQAVVKDPLPEALRFAETVISSLERENTGNDPAAENYNGVDVDAPNPCVDNNAESVCANENDLGNNCCMLHNKSPKPSLMERNSTACTYEWDDSIDAAPEESPDGRGLHLPSPKRRIVSPLKKYVLEKPSRRRKVRRWSNMEEDTLRAGVQKYGAGNWKLILNSYRDVFEERTEVDLKDKWRNMTRY